MKQLPRLRPVTSTYLRSLYACTNYAFLLLVATKPANPRPNSDNVAGSETEVGGSLISRNNFPASAVSKAEKSVAVV